MEASMRIAKGLAGLASAAVLALGCTTIIGGVVGAGPVATDVRTPGEFTRVDVRNGIQLQVEFGQPSAVRLEAPQNLLAISRTRLEGDRLIVDTTTNYTTTTAIRVVVTMPRLDEIAVAGGARGEARGVAAGALVVRAEGGASLALTGTADDLRLSSQGGTSLDLTGLQARRASVELAGGVAARLTATDSVTGTASGGVVLRVSGNPPTLNVATSGGSVVMRDS
jgi:hypothetical protein